MKRIDITALRGAADGKWLSILVNLTPGLKPAVDSIGSYVTCPLSGTEESFKLFDDAAKKGGGFSKTDGVLRDGFALLMWVNDWKFGQALTAVNQYLNVQHPYKAGFCASLIPPAKAVPMEKQAAELTLTKVIDTTIPIEVKVTAAKAASIDWNDWSAQVKFDRPTVIRQKAAHANFIACI